MKKMELCEYDAADFLDTEEVQSAYLNAELADGDPHLIKYALAALPAQRI